MSWNQHRTKLPAGFIPGTALRGPDSGQEAPVNSRQERGAHRKKGTQSPDSSIKTPSSYLANQNSWRQEWFLCKERKLMNSALRAWIYLDKNNVIGSSGQDGGIERNPLLPCTTKRRVTTNLKWISNQECQKIKLHRVPTTKELKKKSTRTTRLVRQLTTWADWEKPLWGGSLGGEAAWEGLT